MNMHPLSLCVCNVRVCVCVCVCVCVWCGYREKKTDTHIQSKRQREREGKTCYREKPLLRAASDPKSIPEWVFIPLNRNKSLYWVTVNRKLKMSLSDLFSATCCHHFEIVRLGKVQKANLISLWEMELHSCSGWDNLCRRTLHFLLKAKCCGFCLDFMHACSVTSVMSDSAICQAPLSMRFSRQEYWSGLPCSLLQGIFPTQGSNPWLLQFLYCRRILYHWATRKAPLLCI